MSTAVQKSQKYLTTTKIDSVWILAVLGCKRYIIGNVYVKRNYENAIADVISMLEKAESLCQKLKATGVILGGDFNSRHTFWKDREVDKNGKRLLEALKFEKFSIINPDTPSFLCVDGSSFIDLFIISNNLLDKVKSINTDDEVHLNSGAPNRGHVPVELEIGTQYVPPKNNIIEKPDMDSVNWKKWSNDLNTEITNNSNTIDRTEDPHLLWSILENSISKVTLSNTKLKRICRHSKPFWTKKLTQLCNEMREARKAYQKRNTDERKEKMRKTREAFDEARKKECENFIMDKTKNLNVTQARSFWKKFNALFKKRDKPGIDPLEEQDGSFLTTPEEIEEKMFETFFQCKHMAQGDFDEYFYHTILNLYEEVKYEEGDEYQAELNATITQSEILKSIKSTDINKTSLDNFNMHPKMLVNLGEPALNVLEKLFNLSLQKGKWVWNTASVIFLRKSGKKSYRIPGSYRPICITSYVGKLLEKILASRLNAFLIKNNFYDPTQEGFTVNRNTIRYLNRLHLEIKADLA